MTRTIGRGVLALLVSAGPVLAQDGHAGHPTRPDADRSAARDEALPPGAEQAQDALNASPRHGEWVDVKVPGETTPVRSWIVYPERKDKAPVVIVIHEIFGLSDWIRAVADRLAADGFIAISPDLISGRGPGGGGTDSVATRDDVVKLVRDLDAATVDRRLDAVHAYATSLPAATGSSAVIGFCWGGSSSFRYAGSQPELDAAVVYYGGAPSPDVLATIRAPVLGLYGGDDARVNATIEPAVAEMKKLGRTYEFEIYEGAGHGFLRAQSGRDGANMKATGQAWPRTVAFLKQHTK